MSLLNSHPTQPRDGSQGTLRVLGLTRYTYAGASSRDRFYHYQPYLERQGIELVIEPLLDDNYVTTLYVKKKRSFVWLAYLYARRLRQLLESRRYHLLFIEKELLMMAPAWLEWLLRRFGIPYAVDYDDAVSHNYDLHKHRLVRTLLGNKIPDVMRHSSLVIAGNSYIAEIAQRAGARRIALLPTAVDTDVYPFAPRQRSGQFSIGWVGSPITGPYLRMIQSTLAELTRDDNVRLIVFGAGALKLEGVRFEAPPWSEAAEPGLIHQFDVGIGPVVDEPFERGKCGFKLIKYMSCGRPVITSPVGMNRDIVVHGATGYLAENNDEWMKHLLALKHDPMLAARMGEAGRRRVEEEYSLEVNAPKLGAMLRSIARH